MPIKKKLSFEEWKVLAARIRVVNKELLDMRFEFFNFIPQEILKYLEAGRKKVNKFRTLSNDHVVSVFGSKALDLFYRDDVEEAGEETSSRL